MEIADLTNTCHHSRTGKRVGVELRPVQRSASKLRLVLELQKQAHRARSLDCIHINSTGEVFSSVTCLPQRSW